MQKIERLSNIYTPEIKYRMKSFHSLKSDWENLSGSLSSNPNLLPSNNFSPENLLKPIPPNLKLKSGLHEGKLTKRQKGRHKLSTKKERDRLDDSPDAFLRQGSLLSVSNSPKSYTEISRTVKDNLNRAMRPLHAIRSKNRALQNMNFPFCHDENNKNEKSFKDTFVLETSRDLLLLNSASNRTFITKQSVGSRQSTFLSKADFVDMSPTADENTFAVIKTETQRRKLYRSFPPESSLSGEVRNSTYIKDKNNNKESLRIENHKTFLMPLFDGYQALSPIAQEDYGQSDVSTPLRADDYLTRPNTVAISCVVSEISSNENTEFADFDEKSQHSSSSEEEEIIPPPYACSEVPLEAVGQSVLLVNTVKQKKSPEDQTSLESFKKDDTKQAKTVSDSAKSSTNSTKSVEVAPLIVTKVILPDEECPVLKPRKVLGGIEREKQIEITHPNKKSENTEIHLPNEYESNQVDRRRFVLARTDTVSENTKDEQLQKIMFTVSHPMSSKNTENKRLKKSKEFQKPLSVKEKTPMLVFFKHTHPDYTEEKNLAPKTKHFKVVSGFTPSQYLQNIGKPILHKSKTEVSDLSQISHMSQVQFPSEADWEKEKAKDSKITLSEKMTRLNQFASRKNIKKSDKPESSKSEINLFAFRKNQEKLKKDHENFISFVQNEFVGSKPKEKVENNKPIPERLQKRKAFSNTNAKFDKFLKLQQLEPTELVVNPGDYSGVESIPQYPGVRYAGDKPHFRRATIPPKQSSSLEDAQTLSFDPRINMPVKYSPKRGDEAAPSAPVSSPVSHSDLSAAILPDSGTSSYRLRHDVSFDEGSRYRNIYKNDSMLSQTDAKKTSPNPSRMGRHLCSMPSPSHISFKETMPLSLIRMEDRLNEIPLAVANSPVTPTSASGITSFMGAVNQKQQSGESPGGGVTSFRLHKGKPNWNCKLGELSINGGGFYNTSSTRESATFVVNGNPDSAQMQRSMQMRERNTTVLKSRMSSRFMKMEDLKCKEKEAVYQDPCISAAASFQQRLTDLSLLESETIKYERSRRLRRKRNQDKDS